MKKLIIIALLITSNMHLFGAYKSQYLDICIPGTFKVGTPWTRLKKACEKGEINQKFIDQANAGYQEKLKNALAPELDRYLTKASRDWFIGYFDGMDLRLHVNSSKYTDRIKQLLQTALTNDAQKKSAIEKKADDSKKKSYLENQANTQDWTVNEVYNNIKDIIAELRELQFDAKQFTDNTSASGKTYFDICKQTTISEKDANIFCGIPLEK